MAVRIATLSRIAGFMGLTLPIWRYKSEDDDTNSDNRDDKVQETERLPGNFARIISGVLGSETGNVRGSRMKAFTALSTGTLVAVATLGLGLSAQTNPASVRP